VHDDSDHHVTVYVKRVESLSRETPVLNDIMMRVYAPLNRPVKRRICMRVTLRVRVCVRVCSTEPRARAEIVYRKSGIPEHGKSAPTRR
jgi:hypothetical protein